MSLIDSTYFENVPLYIPNAANRNAGDYSFPNELQGIIDKYEKELLINFLGVELYNELMTVALDLPNADLKWQNLVNGEFYTFENVTYQFEGLLPIIAKFVYCKYLRDDEFHLTTTGVKRVNSDVTKDISYTNKYVKIWNEFLKEYQNNLYDVAPDIVFTWRGVGLDYFGNGNTETLVSLFTYLQHQNTLDSANFPDITFKVYKPVNTFGI